jgi:hypothetical protein
VDNRPWRPRLSNPLIGVAHLLAMLCAFGPSAEAQTAAFGRFDGPVHVEFGADGRTMKLLQDVVYIDPSGLQWKARKGYATDGASIPRAFWTVVGAPFEGKYRNAAVIHDQYCSDSDHGLRTWQDVHRMFYFALRTSGVTEVQAKVLYIAVLLGGPRWTKPCPGCAYVTSPERDSEGRVLSPPRIDTNQAEQIKRWVEGEGPSLDQIDEYVTSNYPHVPVEKPR